MSDHFVNYTKGSTNIGIYFVFLYHDKQNFVTRDYNYLLQYAQKQLNKLVFFHK